jgi:hypothetical protein
MWRIDIMGYRVDVEIEELELRIPQKDFPLKSNVVVGYEMPFIRRLEDEGCSFSDTEGKYEKDDVVFSEKDMYGIENTHYEWVDELIELCIKYKGTIIVKRVGEDGETEYDRVRSGIRKRVKIVEED